VKTSGAFFETRRLKGFRPLPFSHSGRSEESTAMQANGHMDSSRAPDERLVCHREGGLPTVAAKALHLAQSSWIVSSLRSSQ
jgi:hypothetical protein